MWLLSPFLSVPSSPLSTAELQKQRDSVLEFLKSDGDGKGVKWADKVISPVAILLRESDQRAVLALDKPGPELKNSDRRGDEKRVVLVKFGKDGPRNVDVRYKKDVLEEERAASSDAKL